MKSILIAIGVLTALLLSLALVASNFSKPSAKHIQEPEVDTNQLAIDDMMVDGRAGNVVIIQICEDDRRLFSVTWIQNKRDTFGLDYITQDQLHSILHH